MNWTGHVVAAPRSDLAALLKRPETPGTGIYILLDDNPQRLRRTLACIGEGDEVRTRLKQHARTEEQGGKDFWDRAIVLTSKDANLTKEPFSSLQFWPDPAGRPVGVLSGPHMPVGRALSGIWGRASGASCRGLRGSGRGVRRGRRG
jgi:hypothetical protein